MYPTTPTRTDVYVACACGGTMCIIGAEPIADKPALMHHVYKCVDCGKVAAFELAKKAVQGDVESEIAWLIEFDESVATAPTYYGTTAEGLGMTTDHNAAVRFACAQDAQAIIDDVGWNVAHPVGHMWCDGPNSSAIADKS